MIGTRIGRYEVLEKLGSGGMGEVYRAKDVTLGREAALKLLPAGVRSDPDRLRRFEQEARSASALNHPNIVTIYEVSLEGESPFIAMELVQGHTLRTLLAGRRPLPIKQALDLAAQLAEGLGRAHALGIVHRDLKPENIMVTADGLLKILDFGLAKLQEPPQPLDSQAPTEAGTRPGVLLGTVGYMSPEQASGKPVDFRSDQFSCGAILYEVVTGERAFDRETPVQTLAAIIEDQPPPIVSHNAAVPPPFRWVVERCLAKTPDDRYVSTLDMARELRTLASRVDETTASGPLPPLDRLGHSGRTLAAAAFLCAGFALLAFVPGLRESVQARLGLAPVPARKQIAVLSFANADADPANQVFCDGIAETLTTKLTLLEQFQGALSVVPASEVRREQIASVQEARRAFGVTLAVTGSIQRAGDTVRLTANLVDARTLRQLRTASLDRRLDEVMALQDGVVERVAEMLEVELEPQARRLLAAGGTASSRAYEFYVRGRGQLQRYEKAESLEAAVASFQRALEQDPSYALAYAGLGEAYWRRYMLDRAPEWIELARKACRRAIELNDLLSAVHVTLGLLDSGTGRYAEAIAEFESALKLDPVSAEAYRGLASTYEALGQLDRAESTYERAIELRPDDWSSHNQLGVFHFRRGRYEEAEREFRRVVELTPDNSRGHTNLGGLYQKMGRYADAVAALRKSIAIKPTASAYTSLGTVYFFESRYGEAVPMMEQAIELGAKHHLAWGNLADAYRFSPAHRERAASAYRRAIELADSEKAVNPKNAAIHGALATYWARLGEMGEAQKALETARGLAPENMTVLFKSALVHELGGRRDRALECLRAAVERGYPVAEISREPDLEKLRQDVRYTAFVVDRSIRDARP
jgi:serine/threonine-protein kinase